jgi:hypothetical protein
VAARRVGLAERPERGFNAVMAWRCIVGLLLVGCSSGRAAAPGHEARGQSGTPAASSPLAGQRVVTFEGTCDASGAVPIDARYFAVADDESNVLRVYDSEKGGPPIDSVDMTPSLHLKKKKKPEADLEAATQVGAHALWISSHARTKKGKTQPDRLRFFATSMPTRDSQMRMEGQAYAGLLDDLLREPQLARFDLAYAAERAPQEEGGFNIEGMTATPEGGVLLGFRNPVPQGKALLIAVLNPLDPMHGKPPRFGVPLLLDLGGLGVRSLSYWHGRYLIAAGHYEHGAVSRLYAWQGGAAQPELIATPALDDFNPEGFFTPEERAEIMLLSDDGSREISGERCKDLEDESEMRFRGLWLKL